MTSPKTRDVSAFEETELVDAARRRDPSAIRALIQRYNRRLFRMARSILRDDVEAEEAVQEAYVRAFTRLDTFRGESGFGTWLGRILINEALGILRRRRPTVDLAEVEAEPVVQATIIPFPLGDPERSMANHQFRSMIERAIDSLPDGFRAVFMARVVEEMSIEETAELLDLRPETVKTRLYRARRLLQEALEKEVGTAIGDAFPFDGARCVNMADRVLQQLRIAE